MTATLFEHMLPWSEADFFALGETGQRIELYDGCLLLRPTPTPRHQDLSAEVCLALRPAHDVGLEAYRAVNVRLSLDRILIPDVVIVEPLDGDQPVIEATSVRLVGEIVSPSNAAMDRVLKMHYYAEAGIPYYLLVEQEPLRMRLFRLEGKHYVLDREAEAGTVLSIEDPVRVEIDPGTLG
jgi:Uma2 family endonuclease